MRAVVTLAAKQLPGLHNGLADDQVQVLLIREDALQTEFATIG